MNNDDLKIYEIQITRVVAACSEAEAKRIGESVHRRRGDNLSARTIEHFDLIPDNWQNMVPEMTADAQDLPVMSVMEWLIWKIANNPDYTAFQVEPALVDKGGQVEPCSEDDPRAIWGLYAIDDIGRSEHLGDFETRTKAEQVLTQIVIARHKIRQPQPDEHLELAYEDLVSGLE